MSTINMKITQNVQNKIISAAVVFLLGTPEQVRNSRGKPAISVRATEVFLYSGVVII